MPSQLEALAEISFRAYYSGEDVWKPDAINVEGLHAQELEQVLHLYSKLKNSQSVSNVVLEGRPGSGKTHFLGRVRRRVMYEGDLFVLAQPSSASQFWQTLVISYLSALARPLPSGQSQMASLAASLLQTAGACEAKCVRAAQSKMHAAEIASLRTVMRRHFGPSPEGRAALDVAIALMLQDCGEYDAQDVGQSYLEGTELDESDQRRFGFRKSCSTPRETMSALDRIVGLAGKVAVVAIDQLDGLIAISSHETDDEDAALADLNVIANGLMDLAQDAQNSLIVLSCLRASWERIRTEAIQSAPARFPVEERLGFIPSPQIGEDIIAAHFAAAFERVDFTPPYPTWPIEKRAFKSAPEFSPRRLMELAEAHVRKCRRDGKIAELSSFVDEGATIEGVGVDAGRPVASNSDGAVADLGSADFVVLDAAFAKARAEFDASACLDDKTVDDSLPELLQAALSCWIDENSESGSFSLDPLPGAKPALHARLRLTLDSNTEAERHWSFRAVHNGHPTAALNRLRAAVSWSGLALGLSKRRLIILRNIAWSGGSATQKAVAEFNKFGGMTLGLDAEDLSVFGALAALRKKNGANLAPWLKARRPASGTKLLATVLGGLADSGEPNRGPAGSRPGQGTVSTAPSYKSHSQAHVYQAPGYIASPHKASPATAPRVPDCHIRLGLNFETGVAITTSLEALRRHMAVFAGSGSGKTVLIRRLVEECALAGVSSIVLDPNNDLARLGTPWPEPPDGWLEGDEQRARKYLEQTEVVVWTPGRQTGRPLSFQPIGDLTSVINDADEFGQAIDSAVATLLPRAGLPRSGARADQGQAVLREALRQFARDGGQHLKAFLDYLADLPEDISQIADAPKIAHGMAQTLIAATVNDPLFGGAGEPVDPGDLLSPSPGKTARISVISMIGLPNDDQRQSFVNQLQMALFGWAKRNPAGDRPLGGLYVMDEAQTFAPSSPSTACTQSTLALAAQARKYGLGLMFATQAPKGLHNRIAGNATTQFYGFMNSPAQIQAVREIAVHKGGDVPDIARLTAGTFYVTNDTLGVQKLRTPMCLSWHPKSPLSPMDVLALASKRV